MADEYLNSLTDMKGIGLKTARNIHTAYPNREALVHALMQGELVLDIPKKVETILREHLLPTELVVIPSDLGWIRASQPLTINYIDSKGTTRSFFVPKRWVPLPEDHVDVLDSRHFNDLLLMGRLRVKA